ncbi:cell division protein FtsX [Corallincola luteus]|uniref:Cell division protein FtsX n=2 Tax=Corallincola TaxID=1775176 RepID=A0A368NLH6_9GAMM|nr:MULTISPECIES: permease-like cell division protein FtsX [Corallincola]RCU50970.1 cell division protein FtsX [Corallincola holothuriorum]TCI04032.1 cell division protein FtsX [Corallincola luteus]
MSLLFKERADSNSMKPKLSFAEQVRSFFINHLRQSIAALGDLWRTPVASLMTMAVLGLSLSLPAALYVLQKNAVAVSSAWQNAAEISLFLRQDLSPEVQRAFSHRIGLHPEVDSVTLISPDAGLEDFKLQSGFGDALAYLDRNPLPAVVVVLPTLANRGPNEARALLQKLESAREVDMGKMDIDWLERLDAIIALIQDSFGALATLLLVSVVLIVGNTIRLAIMGRKEEIEVMKLVGATDGFIQRPFLYTGLWYGIVGAMISWIAISLIIWWLADAIQYLSGLYQSSFELTGISLLEALFLLLLSSLLGLCGAYISVKRHIAHIEPA